MLIAIETIIQQKNFINFGSQMIVSNIKANTYIGKHSYCSIWTFLNARGVYLFTIYNYNFSKVVSENIDFW